MNEELLLVDDLMRIFQQEITYHILHRDVSREFVNQLCSSKEELLHERCRCVGYYTNWIDESCSGYEKQDVFK